MVDLSTFRVVKTRRTPTRRAVLVTHRAVNPRVRLRFSNGVVLDDDTQDSVVVFVTDEHVEPPTTAVLYDDAGHEVRAHEVIPGG